MKGTAITLDGKRIALLIAPRGTEDREFAQPKAAVEAAGGTIDVIGLSADAATTNNHDLDPGETYQVDQAVANVTADVYDGLIIPGGCVGADKLRGSEAVVALVKGFFAAGKPVAAICHAPWTLVEAGEVRGRTLTSFPTLKTDIENAGGKWVDQEVVVDQGLVTSRNPDDLQAFCAKLVAAFAEGRHAAATA